MRVRIFVCLSHFCLPGTWNGGWAYYMVNMMYWMNEGGLLGHLGKKTRACSQLHPSPQWCTGCQPRTAAAIVPVGQKPASDWSWHQEKQSGKGKETKTPKIQTERLACLQTSQFDEPTNALRSKPLWVGFSIISNGIIPTDHLCFEIWEDSFREMQVKGEGV